jgi:hypothetical protein
LVQILADGVPCVMVTIAARKHHYANFHGRKYQFIRKARFDRPGEPVRER